VSAVNDTSDYVHEIERAIQDMAAKAASLHAGEAALETGYSRGWWVLAVGDALDEDSLEQRECMREALRRELAEHSIRLGQYVWIWDETNRAQVVLRSFERRELAETFAAAMERRGIRVRVAREWDTDGDF